MHEVWDKGNNKISKFCEKIQTQMSGTEIIYGKTEL